MWLGCIACIQMCPVSGPPWRDSLRNHSALQPAATGYPLPLLSIQTSLLLNPVPSWPQVALSCVSFWQDTYLAQLVQACSGPQGQGAAAGQLGPQHSGAVVLHSHLPLLAQLLAGLVSRAALGPEAAATATADARDLPEEVRMVRCFAVPKSTAAFLLSCFPT